MSNSVPLYVKRHLKREYRQEREWYSVRATNQLLTNYFEKHEN